MVTPVNNNLPLDNIPQSKLPLEKLPADVKPIVKDLASYMKKLAVDRFSGGNVEGSTSTKPPVQTEYGQPGIIVKTENNFSDIRITGNLITKYVDGIEGRKGQIDIQGC